MYAAVRMAHSVGEKGPSGAGWSYEWKGRRWEEDGQTCGEREESGRGRNDIAGAIDGLETAVARGGLVWGCRGRMRSAAATRRQENAQDGSLEDMATISI